MNPRLFVTMFLLSGACAASPRIDIGDLVEVKPPMQSPSVVVQPSPDFERILGSFSIVPNKAIFLTPAVLEANFDGTHEDDGFSELVERFRALGVLEKQATALLNWGAILWFLGRSHEAYERVMESHRIFAELGDVEGLAHAYEWLGYFLRESQEIALAAEHLAVAYQMFELLADRDACRRVIAYAP